MAYPQTYIPHTDLDPAQPPYAYNPAYPAANFSQPRHPLQGQAQHFHHAPNQQYGLPNQAHGHGPPSSMPPPSFYRQNYPYGSEPRAPDRWPLGTTDDQRQQQSQAPHALSPYHQHSPISTAPLPGPVSTFPHQTQNRSPPQNQSPQSPHIFRSPSAAAQKSQPPMTAAAVKAVPPSNPALSALPADPAKSAPSSRVSPTLEAQRVTTLLELNRVLLQEVVAVQNAHKAISNPSQPQTNSLQTNPSSTADATPAADTYTQSDPAGASSSSNNKPATDTTAEDPKVAPSTTNKPSQQQQQQQQQQAPPPYSNKVLQTKEYAEYMRRLQANLAYLASVADRNHKPGNAVPLFPAIMEPPVLPPPPKAKQKDAEQEADARETIKQLYGKIRDLWPEYKGPGASGVATTTSGGPAAGGAPTQARPVATSAM